MGSVKLIEADKGIPMLGTTTSKINMFDIFRPSDLVIFLLGIWISETEEKKKVF